MKPRDDAFLMAQLDRRRRHICRLKWCDRAVEPPREFCSIHHAREALLGYSHPRCRRERTRIVERYEAWLRAHKVPLGQWPMWLFIGPNTEDDIDDIPWQDIAP